MTSAEDISKKKKKSKKEAGTGVEVETKTKKRKLEDNAEPKPKKSKSDKPKKKRDAESVKGDAGGNDAEPASPAAVSSNPLALDNFRLSANVKSLLRSKGIDALFEIQSMTLHHGLDGQDVVGRARTGCGKTLAFVLPIIERLLAESNGQVKRPFGRPPAVIVLAPTRELAKQVGGGAMAAPWHNRQPPPMLCAAGSLSADG